MANRRKAQQKDVKIEDACSMSDALSIRAIDQNGNVVATRENTDAVQHSMDALEGRRYRLRSTATRTQPRKTDQENEIGDKLISFLNKREGKELRRIPRNVEARNDDDSRGVDYVARCEGSGKYLKVQITWADAGAAGDLGKQGSHDSISGHSTLRSVLENAILKKARHDLKDTVLVLAASSPIPESVVRGLTGIPRERFARVFYVPLLGEVVEIG